MQTQPDVVFAHAALHQDIVGLLETDAIAVVVSHYAILDDRPEAAVQANAAATTPVQIHVLLLVSFDDEVFHARAFDVIAADDGENRGGLGLVGHQAIRVRRPIDAGRV